MGQTGGVLPIPCASGLLEGTSSKFAFRSVSTAAWDELGKINDRSGPLRYVTVRVRGI